MLFIFPCPATGPFLEGFQGVCRGEIRRIPSRVLIEVNGRVPGLTEGGEVEMAAHACEHQGADMQLQHEFSGQNKFHPWSRWLASGLDRLQKVSA
jgi:hypothetical protein